MFLRILIHTGAI